MLLMLPCMLQKSIDAREGALSAVECLTYKLGRCAIACLSVTPLLCRCQPLLAWSNATLIALQCWGDASFCCPQHNHTGIATMPSICSAALHECCTGGHTCIVSTRGKSHLVST